MIKLRKRHLLALSSAAFLTANANAYTIGVEIHPIPNLLSFIPGVSVISGAGELALGENFALSVGGTHVQIDIDKLLNEDENTLRPVSEPTFSKVKGYSLDPGLTYYFSGAQDSFYLSASANMAILTTAFQRQSEQYEIYTDTLSPKGELGYRWLWDSGFQVRLGVNHTQTIRQKIVTERLRDGQELPEDEAEIILDHKDLKDQENKWMPGSTSVNFALGFML